MSVGKISVQKAFWVGFILAKVIVFLIIMVGMLVAFILSHSLELPQLVGVPLLFLPIAVGWLWWSFITPRWRIWALEHVDEPAELLERAIKSRIMWPPGHVLGKTEIKSKRLRERERQVGW